MYRYLSTVGSCRYLLDTVLVLSSLWPNFLTELTW
jgi:hypothetical protein